MIFIQATIQNIGANKYSNMEIPIPSIESQTAIVEYLADTCFKIDRLIAIKQSKIEKLEQYKRSLIYEYVTGKKEVS
jgi:type I restriction enzyme S subunit